MTISSGNSFQRDLQYYKFCAYGFLKNLRLYEPFLMLFFLESGLDFFRIGILYGLREISRNLLEIPAGILADAMGRRKTLAISLIFYMLSLLLFYISAGYTFFITAMILYALGDAFRTGTHKAMIFDYLRRKGWEDQKVYYYGHTRSWSQTGSAVAALVAGFFIFITGDFRAIFLFTAIPYLLNLINILSYPGDLDGPLVSAGKKEMTGKLKKVLREFIGTLRNFRMFRYMSNLSLHTGYYQATRDYLQPVLEAFALSMPVMLFLEEAQRTSAVVGITYFLIFFLTALAARRAGAFSKRFGRKSLPLHITLIAGLVMGLSSGWCYHRGFILASVILFIGIYIMENLRKPIGIAYVADMMDDHILATVLSAESQLHSLIAAVLAPVIGLIADKIGMGMALVVISAILLVFSMFVITGHKMSKRSSDEIPSTYTQKTG